MSGRKPKPTYLKLLEGNPGKRPLNANEPKPKSEVPECPEFLFPEAKKEWKRIVPQLKTLGLLTKIDVAALVGYCQSYALAEKAAKEIAIHGLVTTTDKGNIVQNPEVGIHNTALANMHRFLTEFGMTPSSRSRINIGKDENKKPISQTEKILNAV